MKIQYILCFLLLTGCLFATSPAPAQEHHAHAHHDGHGHSTDADNQKKLQLAIVLDTIWIDRNVSDMAFAMLETPGFAAEHQDHGHGETGNEQGLAFNYGELILESALSDHVHLYTAFHFTDDDAELEEGYLDLGHLPANLGVRIGKFRSAFSRTNRLHRHAWDFYDMPLITDLLLGSHGLIEKGVRVTHQTDFSTVRSTLGMEWLTGENHTSFGANGTELDSGAIGHDNGLQLVTAFGRLEKKLGAVQMDVGASGAWGMRRLSLDDEAEHHDHDDMHFLFDDDTEQLAGETGDVTLRSVDITFIFPLFDGQALTFRAEHMARSVRGIGFTHDEAGTLKRQQSGWYAQIVWQPDRHWDLGIRYDDIPENRLIQNGSHGSLPEDMDRLTVVGSYRFNASSRLRVQYSRNRYRFDETMSRKYSQWTVQFTFSLGGHNHHRNLDTSDHHDHACDVH